MATTDLIRVPQRTETFASPHRRLVLQVVRAFLPTVELYDTAAGIVHPLLGISSAAGHVDAGATAGSGAGAGAGSGARGEVSKAAPSATNKQVEERGMLEAAEFQALARAWPAALHLDATAPTAKATQAAHCATVLGSVRT